MGMEDLFVWAVVLLSFALAVLFGSVVLNQFEGKPYVSQNYTIGNTTIQPLHFSQQLLSAFDWLFLFFAMILTIGLFLSAYFIPSNVVFGAIGFIIALFWLWISPHFSSVWLTLMQMSIFTGFPERFPFINTFIFNLPAIGWFVGLTMNIFLHGKNPSRGL